MDVLLLILRLLLVVILYAFLGMLLLMLWRDLRRTTSERESARPYGQLTVLEAPSDTDTSFVAGTTFSLQPITSIGRSPSNTILIPDTYTSARHALLTWREGQWWLEDRDSRNGTLLNGVRIDSPTIISAGDVIGVGRTRLKFTVGVQPTATDQASTETEVEDGSGTAE